MKSFEELKAIHQRVPVRLPRHAGQPSGVLTVDGQATLVVISSSEPLQLTEDENGWFDLTVTAADGSSILLHNALYTKRATHNTRNGPNFESHVFPNLILFDAHHLSGMAVKAVSFRLENLRYFFHYEYVEWKSLHGASKEALDALRKMGTDGNTAHDFFRPSEMYLRHNVPRFMKFKVKNGIYSVFPATSEQLGWGSISLRTEPMAEITFEEPTSINEALNRVWEWRRFFSQVAMEPLPPISISARAERSFGAGQATFYIPTLELNDDKARLHPGDVPLNRWQDRRNLADVMQRWLLIDEKRLLFRVALDRVIAKMRQRASIGDVVSLCSAIESLPELIEKSPLTDADFDALSTAAAAVAKDRRLDLDPGRIQRFYPSFSIRVFHAG